MKNLNIIKMLAALMVLVPSVNACQEFEMDTQKDYPLNIQIDAMKEYTVNATAASNVVFNISANTPWKITSDQQWCVPTPSMSASSALVSEILVKIEDNAERTAREAHLTVTGEGLEEKTLITIKQASKEHLMVIPYDEKVKTQGESISFKLVSNKPWEIIPSTAFVSKIDKMKGEGTADCQEEIITIDIPENVGATRTGSIKVKTAFEETVFEITQNGYILEYADDPSVTNFHFANGGVASEKVIAINSNLDWKPVVDKSCESWLTLTKIDDEHLKIAVGHNNIFTQRTGNFKLVPAKTVSGFEGAAFTVSQDIALWFSMGGDKREINANTGAVKMLFKAGNNINFNYPVKKGRITADFEEIVFTEGAQIFFNFWGESGALKLWVNADGAFDLSAGGGYTWDEKFYTHPGGISDVKRIALDIVDKPGVPGKLELRLYVNDKLVSTLPNLVDIFTNPAAKAPQLYMQVDRVGGENDYYTLKSLTYDETK